MVSNLLFPSWKCPGCGGGSGGGLLFSRVYVGSFCGCKASASGRAGRVLEYLRIYFGGFVVIAIFNMLYLKQLLSRIMVSSRHHANRG